MTIIKLIVGEELNHAQWHCALRGAAISATPLEPGRTLVLLQKLMKKRSKSVYNLFNCSSQELCWEASCCSICTSKCDPAQLVPGNAAGAAVSPERPSPGQPACSASGFSQGSPAYILLLAPASPLSLPQELLNAILSSARNPARFVYAHDPCLH